MTDKPPESRRVDPFRRQPPTIDLAARDVSARPGPGAPGPIATSAAQPGSPSGPKLDPAPGPTSRTVPPTGARPVPTPPPDATPVRPAETVRTAREPAASPPVAAAARRSPLGAIVGSAILGGIVGAALAVGAERMLAPSPSPQLAQRLNALEQRPSSPPVDPGLAQRLSTLEAAARNPPPQPAPDPGLRQQADALAARLKTVEDAAGQGGAAVQGNAGAIDELRRQAASLRTGLDDQAKQAGAGAQANATALAELTSRVTALQGQAAQQGQAQTSALGAMQGRLGDIEKRLGAIDAAFARFGPETAQAGLRVVVAQRLDTALRAGAPLGTTVATLGRLGAPPAIVDALKPYVEAGAPSTSSLAQEFRPLGDRTVEAARGPASSVGDRLLRMAERVVTVRKVGDAGSGDVTDTVAEIEAALGRGDAAAAAAAWDRLPEASKPISAEWAARLKQRAAASGAAARVQADALAAIDSALR